MESTCILGDWAKPTKILNILAVAAHFMNVKTLLRQLLKPTILKILIFLFIGFFSMYFTREGACGASLFFSFCYEAYGFPFFYAVTGDINDASGYINTLFLGEYFVKSGKFLLNPMAFMLDLILLYVFSCIMAALFEHTKSRMYKNQDQTQNKT